MYDIFGKKKSRTVDYWCEDPKYTGKGEHAFDPIQGVKNLLTELDDCGHTDVVRACLEFLCSDTSIDCGHEPHVTEMLPTVSLEILADYQAVATLQAEIESGAALDVIDEKSRLAIEEIERTFAKYKEGFRR